MRDMSFDFCKTLSQELDPEKLLRKFLLSLLELQNVERGSIWIRKDDGYFCAEAVGSQSEKIKGITIGAVQPSIVGWVIENGKMTIGEPGRDVRHYKEVEDRFVVKSKLILCFPLLLRSGEVYGAVQLIDTSAGGDRLNLNKDYLELLQNIIDLSSIALSNSLVYTDKVRENQRLKEVLETLRSEEMTVGKSPAFLKVLKSAGDYAKTDFPVLITGESGTGKEVVAKAIHRMSRRGDKPFLVQNCSAIPETLLESELFGYEKGAFTGAVKDKVGLFEAANGGTVFLDEIGDMPAMLQARILRVIQNSEVKPLGGTKTRQIDVRIISATNKDLRDALSKEQFREDLFYRLNVLPLHMPPLRERREDIPLLLDHFLGKEALRMGTNPKKVSQESLQALVEYPWRGNIRELENLVKHLIVVSSGDWITLDDLSTHFAVVQGAASPTHGILTTSFERGDEHQRELPSSAFDGRSWDEVEKAYIMYLLEKKPLEHHPRVQGRAGQPVDLRFQDEEARD